MKVLKKLILVFAVMLAFIPILTACGESPDSHKIVKDVMEQFLQHVSYNEEGSEWLFELDKNMSYTTVIEDAIIGNGTYREIRNEYELTVKVVMSFVFKNYGAFAVTPQGDMTSERVDSYNEFEKSIKELENKYDSFIQSKEIFESSVTSSPTSIISNQKLLDYKRAFSNLIKGCEVSFDAFVKAYELTYSKVSGENADVARIGEYYAARVILAYHHYAFVGFECLRFGGRVFLSSRSSYPAYIILPKSSIIAGRESKLKDLTDFAKVYEQEEAMLNIALSESNLREIADVYNGNLEEYKKSGSDKRAYYEKIESFFNDTVPTLEALISQLGV